MRFFADGPSIPNDLIEARNNGDVVFFCGAGVSMTAGLPSFLRLTEQIVDELGVPNPSVIRSAIETSKLGLPGGASLDRLIGKLQGEYGPLAVERAIIKALKVRRSNLGSAHQDLLALSRTRAGQTRLVTTNFDTLFERGARGLKRHVAPFLPDLSSGIPLDGLIYLHGRLDPRPRDATASQNLIIGSADYGRSYLSNGWALRFVKELLSRYIVVLVGYSAEDPPISYLLEGLNGDGPSGRMPIYAFSDGEAAEVRARWKDRGVTAIPYDKLEGGHSGLWRTIAAWAELARDPDSWRSRTIALAQTSPRSLSPHERGQVAAVISSSEGAKAFADSDPPPQAEWLSVFDPVVRYGRPWVPDYSRHEEKIDPLLDYGLDDDPPRPLGDDRQSVRGPNFLAPLSSSDREQSHIALGGGAANLAEALPPRLWHLNRWIGRIADQPASLWWAARHVDLHRQLKDQIEFVLRRNDPPLGPVMLSGWRLLLEGMEVQDHPWGLDTMDIDADIRRHGWAERQLRAFAKLTKPRIKIEPDALRPGRPPDKSPADIELHEIITAQPHFEKWHNALPAADDPILPRIVEALRVGLVEAAGILKELGNRYYRTPDLHFEGDTADRMVSEVGEHLLWFIRMFEDLRQRLPKAARQEAASWPADEPYIFDKLRIWSAIHADLFSGDETADIILDLSDKAFWDDHQVRELLWTLRARWASIPATKRRRIERRLVKGRPRRPNETLKEHRGDRASTSAARLAWLAHEGCALSAPTSAALPKLKGRDPNWREAWGRNADVSFEGSVRRVETKTDYSAVAPAGLSGLADAFRKETQRLHGEAIDRRPFQGLVSDNPSKALAVIAFEGRAGRPALDLWQEMLSSWPAGLKPRLVRLVALRLAKLDQDSIRHLGHAALRWIENSLPPLLHDAGVDPWPIYDAVADAYLSAGPEVLQSNLLGSSYGGQPQRRSRRTMSYATNAPVGILVDTLLKLLPKKPAKGSKLPVEFAKRAERLLNAPGEGRDHAICTLCRPLTYFDFVDPRWTKKVLLPLFKLDGVDAEPAWNGFAYHARLPRKSTFAVMKPDFLRALVALNEWAWDDGPERILAEFLLLTTIHPLVGSGDITPLEAREALQNTTEDARRSCLWRLSDEVKKPDGWARVGAPFALKVWPRERRYQTASISRTWADVAVAAGKDFPDAVRTIIPLVLPAKDIDTLLLSFDREAPGDARLPERFPEATLALVDALLAQKVDRLPYGLGPLVERLATADGNLKQDARWRRLTKLLAG